MVTGFMYSFLNDYSEGAHPKILDMLCKSNLEQTPGYGVDPYCDRARALILNAIGRQDVDVHFLVGGTQTNMTAIAAFLRPHQAALAAVSGHINVHETGAIEATGHKVMTLPSDDGKITAEQIEACVLGHRNDPTFEHITQPKLVYISDSTEVGTAYTKSELRAISEVCKRLDLILFVDGARLGSALTSAQNDLTLADLAELCDAFYIGGTKNGALFGEALVIVNEHLKPDFRYMIKQRGGMLAKGRLLGIQFAALFEDDTYFEAARHANRMATRLSEGLRALGVHFLSDSPTNQIFPILSNAVIERLSQDYAFESWQRMDDDHTAIRLVTSWATDEVQVGAFLEDMRGIL